MPRRSPCCHAIAEVAFRRAIGAVTWRQQLAVGASWVALTVASELALGTALGLTRERMLADYDVANGGFMAFGLLFELLAPALAARLRTKVSTGTRHSI